MSSSQNIANRFEIQDLLGRGGMGEVYRAADTQTGETIAIKALNPKILAHEPKMDFKPSQLKRAISPAS